MRAGLGGLVVVVLAIATPADATTVKRVSLEEAVATASDVFVGTVVARKVVEGGPPRNLLFTEVTFGRLVIEKGKHSARTLTYRFAGGTRGKTRIRVDGVPRFVTGRRYLLLADARIDRLCPLVGWWQGCYVVGRDSRTSEEILCDHAGRPVYGFEAGRPVVRPPSRDSRPVRLKAFLERVRRILRKSAPRDRAPAKGKRP